MRRIAQASCARLSSTIAAYDALRRNHGARCAAKSSRMAIDAAAVAAAIMLQSYRHLSGFISFIEEQQASMLARRLRGAPPPALVMTHVAVYVEISGAGSHILSSRLLTPAVLWGMQQFHMRLVMASARGSEHALSAACGQNKAAASNVMSGKRARRSINVIARASARLLGTVRMPCRLASGRQQSSDIKTSNVES